MTPAFGMRISVERMMKKMRETVMKKIFVLILPAAPMSPVLRQPLWQSLS